MSTYEDSLKLRRAFKRASRGLRSFNDSAPEIETPPRAFRFTVIFDDGEGASVFMTLDNVRQLLPEMQKLAANLKINPDDPVGVQRGREIIRSCVLKRQNEQAAGLLGLFLSWNYPGIDVPTQVERTMAEDGKICITLAINLRLGLAATTVAPEYVDPFSIISTFATATMPAQGSA